MVVGSLYVPARLAISGFDYDFNFKADADTELLVYTIVTVDEVETATLLTLGTDYIVTLSEVTEGGTVQTGSYVLAVWTPAEPSGEEILVQRTTPVKQSTDIPVRGGFKESVIEGGLDDLSKQVQEIDYKLDLVVDDDSTATLNSIARAEAAAEAAETAQAAAEVAEAGAESTVDDAIEDLVDVTTGHRHDGVDARKVLVTSLDITGIADGEFVKRSGAALAGATPPGIPNNIQKFAQADSPGTWTKPAGVTQVYVKVWGAGGGGDTAGGGGGGGAYVEGLVAVSGNVTVTVGAGGAGGGSPAAGGLSSFAGDTTLTGGGGAAASGAAGGAGGTPTNGTVQIAGQNGHVASTGANFSGGAGGGSPMGGNGGDAGKSGGTSGSVGAGGGLPGGGGGGGEGAAAGGAGADGYVIVMY